MPTSIDDIRSLLLPKFALEGQRISLVAYAGEGGAGHLFKVSIHDRENKLKKEYALKAYKFANPKFNSSPREDTRQGASYDPFYTECRANGTLVQQGLNGGITPFCHGWIDVPHSVEARAVKRFEMHPSSWERPAGKQRQRIKGILFEWIDGQELSRVRLSSDIAAQARRSLSKLHSAGIAHGDLRASNFLVNSGRLHLVDLSASIVLPRVGFSAQDLVRRKANETQSLEIGLSLLTRLPVNQGLRVTDVSRLHDLAFDSPGICFLKERWAPPQPTCWQEKQEQIREQEEKSVRKDRGPEQTRMKMK